MYSRSGQGGVFSQQAYVVARLPGQGGLESQVGEGLNIRGTYRLDMRRDVSEDEVAGEGLVGQDFNPLGWPLVT